MHGHDSGGNVVPLLPAPLTSSERSTLRVTLTSEVPKLRALLDAASAAADGPDPEAALVFLGMLSARATRVLFPL